MPVMASNLRDGFRLGPWSIEPLRGAVSGPNGNERHLEPKVMDILLVLAEHANEVVTRDKLLDAVWQEQQVSDERLTHVIAELRRTFQDGRGHSGFITTVPKRGYRLVGQIRPLEPGENASTASGPDNAAQQRPVTRIWAAWGVGGVVIALLAVLVVMNAVGLRDRLTPGDAELPITAIAVLPLKNLTGDPEEEYFADGMTEALITELSKIGALQVISRQSVMRFKGTGVPMPEIGRQLNVDAVVEGSVMHVGKTVRISVQLIAAATDRHLWAESYDRDFEDVLSVHSEVARSIAGEIHIAVTPQETARLTGDRKVHPDAYRHYLWGRYHLYRWEPQEQEKAIRNFEQAIALDPQYAAAYAGLADCYGTINFFGFRPPRDYVDKWRDTVALALELDDSLANAYEAAAVISYYYDWDWIEAETAFRRAISLNENYADAYQLYTWYLLAMGRFEDAQTRIDQAIELDPLAINALLTASDVLYVSRQFERAVTKLQEVLVLDEENPVTLARLGASFVQLGRLKEAIANLERAVSKSDGNTEHLWMLGYAYAVAGREAEARDVLDRLDELAEKQHVQAYGFAVILVGLKEYDEALGRLQQAYRDHNPRMVYLQVTPQLDPLRHDPRFQHLVGRMNFPK